MGAFETLLMGILKLNERIACVHLKCCYLVLKNSINFRFDKLSVR